MPDLLKFRDPALFRRETQCHAIDAAESVLLSKATENTGLPNGVTTAHIGHPCGASV